MSTALRVSSFLYLARRAPFLLIYKPLMLIALTSVGFACLQAAGFHFWPTHVNQATGLFFSPIAQGGFLALTIVAIAQYCWWPIPILALGLYLCHNRGGWAVAGIGLLATYIRQPLVILTVILLGTFFVTLNPSFGDLERLNIWQTGLVNLTWFGHGWGSFSDVWIVIDGFGHRPMHAHNDYLEFAFEFGLYTIPIFCVLAYALSQTQSPEWPLLVAFCFMATFAMPSFIPATAGIGALALATVLTKGANNG